MMSEAIRKVVIIGSGPAGHTAAIYAARAELNPLMFEGFLAGGVAAGGQLTTTTHVENFPGFPDGILGAELMDNMRKQSISCGAEIRTETIERVDLSERPFKIYVEGQKEEHTLAESIIIATGATAKRLNLDGETELWNKGISACAVCDGALPVFRKKPLVVIGGGDSACEEAIFLTKYASSVTMFVRRDALRASKAMQTRAMNNEKIDILFNTEAVKVLGGENNDQVESIRYVTNGEEKEMPCNGLFYAVGHIPNTGFLRGQLECDEQGYVVTKAGTVETSVRGVFAAGDVQDKLWRQAITAAGSGCMAALSVEHFLSE